MDGKKYVCLFTTEEQGRNRRMFSCWKIVWDKILELIWLGYEHMTKTDMIYKNKGLHKSVTDDKLNINKVKTIIEG